MATRAELERRRKLRSIFPDDKRKRIAEQLEPFARYLSDTWCYPDTGYIIPIACDATPPGATRPCGRPLGNFLPGGDTEHAGHYEIRCDTSLRCRAQYRIPAETMLERLAEAKRTGEPIRLR